MAAIINFDGHVGKDPVVSFTPDGLAVCRFSVASSGYANKQKTTNWYNVTVMGKRGEHAGQRVKKGDRLFISGEHQPREYEKDGKTRVSEDVLAHFWDFAGGKKDGDGGGK